MRFRNRRCFCDNHPFSVSEHSLEISLDIGRHLPELKPKKGDSHNDNSDEQTGHLTWLPPIHLHDGCRDYHRVETEL